MKPLVILFLFNIFYYSNVEAQLPPIQGGEAPVCILELKTYEFQNGDIGGNGPPPETCTEQEATIIYQSLVYIQVAYGKCVAPTGNQERDNEPVFAPILVGRMTTWDCDCIDGITTCTFTISDSTILPTACKSCVGG